MGRRAIRTSGRRLASRQAKVRFRLTDFRRRKSLFLVPWTRVSGPIHTLDSLIPAGRPGRVLGPGRVPTCIACCCASIGRCVPTTPAPACRRAGTRARPGAIESARARTGARGPRTPWPAGAPVPVDPRGCGSIRPRAAVRGWTPRPVRQIMQRAVADEAPMEGGGTMADAPQMFLSYSHDSAEHAARVLALADALCDLGIDVILDRYVHPAPDEGWPRWMERNLDAADFVLMVCTATYRRRVRGEEESGQGTGVRWEGMLIYNRIAYGDPAGARFIPILLPGSEPTHIPNPVQGHA